MMPRGDRGRRLEGAGCDRAAENASFLVDAVVIGRNEGVRLIRCLDSMKRADLRRIVYVDSGSTDGSIAEAESRGVEVLRLDLSVPFTAARARNAGLDRLRRQGGGRADLVQFIYGDCELDPGWIGRARAFLQANPGVAGTGGRCRERFPGASVYNRFCDREWDTPVGEARALGGNAMFRMAALDQVGGFDPALIAGEEPELCVRLRARGWTIRRIDGEMVLHDAAMTRFGQFWKRARRAGFAFAQGYAMHGAAPERHYAAPLRRAILWGAVLPAAAFLGAVAIHPVFLALLLLWPAQILRLWRRDGDGPRAALLTIAKIPEALGAFQYLFARLFRRKARLIEYK
mgnify:CR=1 FL=1